MLLEELKPKLHKDLIDALEKQKRSQDSIAIIEKAYEFAFQKHINQTRRSGDAYITHPVTVAKTLIELKCDTPTICAGLLHDVLEDTETSINEMKKNFGEVTYELVDGVTKLGKNCRKMLLAIAKDMRVVLVKLADRLHNMQTLQYLNDEKRYRIARETLDIFAPLANRFGLHAIKTELEDLCFKHLYPEEFEKVKLLVSSK